MSKNSIKIKNVFAGVFKDKDARFQWEIRMLYADGTISRFFSDQSFKQRKQASESMRKKLDEIVERLEECGFVIEQRTETKSDK